MCVQILILFSQQTTDSWLYTQLCYYQYIFDFERARIKLSDKEQCKYIDCGKGGNSFNFSVKFCKGCSIKRYEVPRDGTFSPAAPLIYKNKSAFPPSLVCFTGTTLKLDIIVKNMTNLKLQSH